MLRLLIFYFYLKYKYERHLLRYIKTFCSFFTCPSYIDLFGTNPYTHVLLLLLHGTQTFLFVPLHTLCIDDCIFECLDCKVKFVSLQIVFQHPHTCRFFLLPFVNFIFFNTFYFSKVHRDETNFTNVFI